MNLIPYLRVDLSSINLSSNDVLYLCNIFLKKMNNLDELGLNLRNNELGNQNIIIIEEVISELINLKKLDLNLGSNLVDFEYNV